MNKVGGTMIVIAGLALLATQAQAELLVTKTRQTNFTFNPAFSGAVPLNNAGGTSASFNTSAASQKVVISYSAECSVASTTAESWINVDILVDGVVAKPTNSDDALCTTNGSGDHQYTRVTVNAVITVPLAGAHTVQVNARFGFGDGTGWLGDTSLIVWR